MLNSAREIDYYTGKSNEEFIFEMILVMTLVSFGNTNSVPVSVMFLCI